MLPWWFSLEVLKRYFRPGAFPDDGELVPEDERCSEYCAYCDEDLEPFEFKFHPWTDFDESYSEEQLDHALRLWDGTLVCEVWCRGEKNPAERVLLSKSIAPTWLHELREEFAKQIADDLYRKLAKIRYDYVGSFPSPRADLATEARWAQEQLSQQYPQLSEKALGTLHWSYLQSNYK